jgi:hypothetical protein
MAAAVAATRLMGHPKLYNIIDGMDYVGGTHIKRRRGAGNLD